MQQYLYLIIDIACISIPLIASFYPKHAFYKEWKYFFPANIFVAILFLVWDYYFTKIGVWGFNPDYLSGIFILNLPIEEVLFFIAIPYASVFTYFALKYLIKIRQISKFTNGLSIFLLAILITAGVFNLDKSYTSLTFILTSAFLFITFIKKINVSYLYLSYLFIIPFFIASNGILTGSLIESPIVYYNDNENLGIRLFTIPIEDSVYGFLLIGLNVTGYEFIARRFKF